MPQGKYPRERTVPTCHPDRKHFAYGLCNACYLKEYRRKGFDVSTETYVKLFEQGCGICGEHFKKTPHYDHNHKTGAFRGLLCRPCNMAIGIMKDDVKRIRSAAEYLERCS